MLVADLLKSTGQFLEAAVDECFSLHNPEEEQLNHRQKIVSACREYKLIFKEVRERASKTLGIAKMLQKDLGIAAEFDLKVSCEEILETLRVSGHVQVRIHNKIANTTWGENIFSLTHFPRCLMELRITNSTP